MCRLLKARLYPKATRTTVFSLNFVSGNTLHLLCNTFAMHSNVCCNFYETKQPLNPVVPNRGGIPPWGGISWVQGRNFHFIVKLPNHSVLIKFTLALSMSSITLYLSVIQWTSTRICWQALVLLFGNNFFRSTFINQVFVTNKDHCSNCSYY